MATIVLEYLVTQDGSETVKPGTSIFVDATTDTSLVTSVQAAVDQLGLDPSACYRLWLLLGDHGAQRVWISSDSCVNGPDKKVGHYLCHDRPIPVKIEPLPAESMGVHVKLLSGKTIDLKVNPVYTIGDVKIQIYHKAGVPPDQQRMVLSGRHLEEDGQTLSDYYVLRDSTITLVLRLRGGFVDVTRSDALRNRAWNKSAPDWRIAAPGLCIEGRCGNPSCKAYRKMVVVKKGFEDFDLFGENSCFCPMCQESVVPIKPGFNNCLWKISAVKLDAPESIFHRPWTKAGDEYTTYDEATAGTAEFSRLQIFVRRLPEPVLVPTSASPRPSAPVEQDDCPICIEALEKFGTTAIVPYPATGCGHHFHSDCLSVWRDTLSQQGKRPFCPMCRASG